MNKKELEILREMNKSTFALNPRKEYEDDLFIVKLREGGLSDEQIKIVKDAIETTCNKCWDDDADCQCWNDD